MRRLQFSHEIGGDWAEHVEPALENVCLPAVQQQRAALHRKCRDWGLASANESSEDMIEIDRIGPADCQITCDPARGLNQSESSFWSEAAFRKIGRCIKESLG
jgi:hypothetical protein